MNKKNIAEFTSKYLREDDYFNFVFLVRGKDITNTSLKEVFTVSFDELK